MFSNNTTVHDFTDQCDEYRIACIKLNIIYARPTIVPNVSIATSQCAYSGT